MNRAQSYDGLMNKHAIIKTTVCMILAAGAGFCPANATPETYVNASTQSVQQSVVVKGVVKDAKGEPIIGASVLEKGSSSHGTVTDLDGRYTLSIKKGSSLVVSYVGFHTQTVAASTAANIVLVEDQKVLNEVVVMGDDTQRKGDVTSAITSIKSEDFLKGKIGDAAELIKGKIAGLSIVKSSGDPNSSSSIMLRGITTIKGGVEPLVLIDGIEGSLTTVAPENIAEIDVLKDASASAIYGTRGANGVIIITT